ncbi:MAG: hypothetical protein HKP44_10955 [Desulfofustis sp.]|nr:hypothetical protein [Desulfofustis sp.]
MDRNDLMNGVLAPVITPFGGSLEPDVQKLSNTAAGCWTTVWDWHSSAPIPEPTR